MMLETILWKLEDFWNFLLDSFVPFIMALWVYVCLAFVVYVGMEKFQSFAQDVHVIAEHIRSTDYAGQADSSD